MSQLVRLRLTIDTEKPILLDEFVGAFSALDHDYRRFIQEHHERFQESAAIYVSEVRQGSFVAELIPQLVPLAPFISHMDQVLVVEQFVRNWGSRLRTLFDGKLSSQDVTRKDLEIFTSTVQAIARDPNASSRLEAVNFDDGTVRAAFQFQTSEAKFGAQEIHRLSVAQNITQRDKHERVLMVFTRSSVEDAKLDKRSGEKGLIEQISQKSLPLMYSSEDAEARIKRVMREADDNVYKKGFVVDVDIITSRGRQAAYAITRLHDVLDL